MTVSPGTDHVDLSLRDGGADFRITAGLGRWVETDGVVASGGATESGALVVDAIFVETPHRLRIECAVDGTFVARWMTQPLHPLPLAQMRMPRA